MADEIDDRLSRRFETTEDDRDQEDSDDAPQQLEAEMSSIESQTSENDQTSQNAQNVKKEWNVRSFYLDDDLNSSLSTAFKRLDLELSESDTDIDLKKTRHFYPLLVELGLERLEEMDITEVTERLESKDSV
ncbi:hypothetical protein HLRTI_003278 [Halorhabdus tiamatea SARL4B]|uniref:DUF8160 domain-containing protein n=1 Tax=Halorhabdus tiamatea SARL4B TaxID=1033806 RepID=F7PPU7_9EURY|nr:hypothetical protein [Halorhabdus tiamatea]ERJ04766.1 hypothetical protein HLRTI_003278 [Halorhabdus tiamatea SARL4B]CCQ34954.1 hypothetical protein HTIA_p2852 [Halorhabdus tiamatea SARL4B]